MNRLYVMLAVVTMTPTFALAQSLSDVSQFAESICGDIPQGDLTRTSIEGKVGANAGWLAKIISGNADVSASRTQEIYHGIPFDKLPDKIPTVSMCKSQLVNVIFATKANQSLNAPRGINQTGDNAHGTVINNDK
jgi:hypothetical protein